MAELTLITTGGTIAMARRPDAAGADMALDAEALVAAAGLGDADLRLRTRQIFSAPSANIGLAQIRRIAHAAQMALGGGSEGVVITHGTDTLEETAFGLDLLLDGVAPVVLTGAMRPADAPGADGPSNIAAALAVARSPACRNLGVLVAIGDEVHAAPYLRKTHTSSPAAFSSLPIGPLGWVAEGRVHLMLRPARRLRVLRPGRGSPHVPLIGISADTDPAWLRAAARGTTGLIVELAGGGHAPARLASALGQIAAGRPTVFASRTGGGSTLSHTYAYAGGEMDLLARGLIGAGPFDARKARLALSLLLSGGADTASIRAWFDAPFQDEHAA